MRQLLRMAAVCLLATAAMAQMPVGGGYLDVFTVQVKPEKRAEFDAFTRKLADANRRGGDNWVAYETIYGEGNVVSFVSARNKMGDAESASDLMYRALVKAYGEAGAGKLFADLNSCAISTHGEIRARRMDLSANAPADQAAYNKVIGTAKWLRTTMVRVRIGKASDFEAGLKRIKEARQRSAPDEISLVSQAVAGQTGIVYYITTLKPQLGDYDNMTSMQKLLGDDYDSWQKSMGEVIVNMQANIYHFLPALSNPPAEIAAAAPDFWHPKPVMATKPKPAAAGEKAK